VYTEEVPFVCRLWPVSAEALVAVLEELLVAHDAGRLDPNLAGRAYALEEFDDEKLADNLTALIRAYASPDSG
jgi:hypothetical protein